MKSFKPIAHLLLSLFLGYQSIELIRALLENPHLTTTESLVVSVMLNLFVTGTLAFVGFSFPTARLLPISYYHIRNPKRMKKIHSLLQLRLYQKFLLATFWKGDKSQMKFYNGTRDGLKNMYRWTLQSEFGHLIAGLVIQSICIIMWIRGYSILALTSTAINLFFNIYPVLLQRHHRMRLQQKGLMKYIRQ